MNASMNTTLDCFTAAGLSCVNPGFNDLCSADVNTNGCGAACCPPPPPGCGNNIREGAEECDGTDTGACPGPCLANCTCAVACGETLPGVFQCAHYAGVVCPPGQVCSASGFGNASLNTAGGCFCVPGFVPCDASVYDPVNHPICGGACPEGKVCTPFKEERVGAFTVTPGCVCMDEGAVCGPYVSQECDSACEAHIGQCPSGQVCAVGDSCGPPSPLCNWQCGTP
jgi:hypothetical protein